MSDQTILHASAVAVDGRALLIRGQSGSGKSSLALDMMALGARLVADDRVILCRDGDALIARPPDVLSGLIEARGLGLLRAEPLASARVAAMLDLDQSEPHRLPPRRDATVLGCTLPLLHKSELCSFPAALMQYLRGGRKE